MERKHFNKIWCITDNSREWIWFEKMIPPIGTIIQVFSYNDQPNYYEITGYTIENVRRYFFRKPSLIMHLTEIEL